MFAQQGVALGMLVLSAGSVIRLQSTTAQLKFAHLVTLLTEKSIASFIVLDPEFLDFAQHDFPVLVNQVSEDELITWVPNRTQLYDHSNYIDIVLLGLKPKEALFSVVRQICGNWTTTGYRLEPSPQCPHAMSEKFIVLGAASNTFGLENISRDDKHELGHLSHALLFLWYEEAHLKAAEVLCQHCNGADIPKVIKLDCNFSNADKGQFCLENVYGEYLSVLFLPAPCYIDAFDEPVNVSTPFHNSSHASLNLLECERNESLYSTRVSDWLTSSKGNYPSDAGFLLLSQSQPYYVITSDKSFVVLSSAKNPYLSPFDGLTWASIGAVLTAFMVVVTFALYLNGQNLYHSLAAATCWGVGAFLDQVRVHERATERTGVKCYVQRLLLVALTIPAMVLTNHYRSALHSEFTVTDENYLNIDGIEDLRDFKLYLLLDGKECEEFNAQMVQRNDTVEAGRFACLVSSTKGECLFVQQAIMGSIWSENFAATTNPSYRERLANVDRIYRNVSFACIQDLDEFLRSMNGSEQKIAFVASYDIVDLAWVEFEKAVLRNPAIKFYYKEDQENSFFLSPNGITFPLKLGAHQVWVRRKLRSMFDSGMQLLWARWERWETDKRFGKMWEIYSQSSRKENPISLENSWIPLFLFVCASLMGVAFVIFLLELGTKAA